ncbi:MAG: hypothetical protein HQK89_15455 [Nitrospirae bacterium]|nr:hypothetical protein [Nitrospirota bacterium]
MKKTQFKNVSHIYILFDALETEALKQMVTGETESLEPDIRARVEDIKQVATEIGWSSQDLVKALNIVITNRANK